MDFTFNTVFLSSSLLLGMLCLVILIHYSTTRKFYILPLTLNLVATTAWIFHRLLLETGLILQVPHLFRFSTPLAVLAGPTVYLYVRAMVGGELHWHKRDWLHFIPSTLVVLFLSPFYFKSAENKIEWLEMLYKEPTLFSLFGESILPDYWQHWFNALVVILYGGLSIRLIINYLRESGSSRPGIPKGTVRWMFYHSIVIVILGLTGISVLFIEMLPNVIFYTTLNTLAAALLLPLFFLLFLNPPILYGVSNWKLRESHSNGFQDRESYGLTETRIIEVKQALQKAISEQKPFLNKDLSLEQLAHELNISRHQLSYIINREYQTNFSGFINDLRIQHCLENLSSDEWNRLTIEGVANQVGFGNRGTFTRAFKKKTGKQPSDYRKTNLFKD